MRSEKFPKHFQLVTKIQSRRATGCASAPRPESWHTSGGLIMVHPYCSASLHARDEHE